MGIRTFRSPGQVAAARCVAGLIAMIGFFGSVSLASADSATGGFCPAAAARVSNDGNAMVYKPLWEFKGAAVPADPVFGWVDVACFDRGPRRSSHQDVGIRVFFNVSGPAGAPASEAKIKLSAGETASESNTVGIRKQGQSIIGVVGPRYACAYAVAIWSESCAPR